MTNLDEFLAQTDPIRADTDGDGLSDADELAGLSSGAPDLDPLVPATFLADEPDTDGNGVPDLWDNAGLPNYWGVDAQEFPEYLAIAPEAATNADVIVRIDSSRTAALSWGEGPEEPLLLPPCTNLALRLRLPTEESRAIRLSPGPAVGPWKAALRAEGDPRPGATCPSTGTASGCPAAPPSPSFPGKADSLEFSAPPCAPEAFVIRAIPPTICRGERSPSRRSGRTALRRPM